MWNFARTRVLVVGLACLAWAATGIAMAENNSSAATPSSQPSSLQSDGVQTNASSGQAAATNSSNLPSAGTGTATEQQTKAPVADPQAAARDATEGKTAAGQASNPQNANTNANPEWPAPQRYEAGRGPGGNMRQGGASLGVNVSGSGDGQGIVVSRIWPGTPADKMGLRPRDRIITVNGQPVGSIDEFITTIRAMNAGDQIQLSIDRNGNASNVGGRLEAFRESVAAGQGPVGSVLRGARDMIRERDERIGDRYRSGGPNVQTSFEDGGSSARSSADVDARINRLEQKIEQLTQEIQQLRTSQSASPLQTGTPGGAGGSPSPLSTPSSSLPPASK